MAAVENAAGVEAAGREPETQQQPQDTQNNGRLELKVKGSGFKPFTLESVAAGSTVAQLKATCKKHTNMPVEMQRLLHKGKVLQDTQTLEDAGVPNKGTLFLVKGVATGAAAAALEEVVWKDEVRRFAKADIDDLVKNKFRTTFLKEPCAECGKPATKRFSGSMSVIVAQMLDSFWCNECGRVLCESHRHQHTCERLDHQKERNKHLTGMQVLSQYEQADRMKIQAAEEKAAAERAAAEARERERLIRKDKRELLAKKAKYVEDFLQGFTRDTEATAARGNQVREELLHLYVRARRLALTLFNEYEHPSSNQLAEEEWMEVKEVYERARELTGLFIMVEGQPLDMRNPWDPPPAPAQNGGVLAADGGGFGRGLL